MKGAARRQLLASLSLLMALLLPGCAAHRSVVVLLPEGGKVSGEVTVVTAQGSQLLNKSWQSVEIPGTGERPTSPVVLGESAVHGMFGPVLAAMPTAPVHYLLYFRLDSTELLPESQLLLPKIARVIGERHPAQLSVVGHTDSMGSTEYNYRLGLQRAAAVLRLLAAQGAVPAGTETLSRGKADPQVKTPDQFPEPRNRRAEVTVR